MIRTQISLDERDYREAKAEAKRCGISLAAFLRRAVAAMLASAAGPAGDRPWMRYAGIASSGDASASETIDEVVYGRQRP